MFGNGQAKDIETYAVGLSELILKVKSLVCAWSGPSNERIEPKQFRCYLVAHSMGGLVARAFLQNAELGEEEARRSVDKLFTLATPHNGIDVAGINVPTWLTAAEQDTFNRQRMAEFLDMKDIAQANDGRVDFMPENVLSSDRIFCMVGTNRGDYEVGQGLVRAFVGHGSDGLVRIANASLWGIDAKTLKRTQPVATAFAYRSHSGAYGIVNSEEAYQNLTRFLFGDVRVDIWMDISEVRLPPALEDKADSVEALYEFELLAAPRGKRWFLTRRVAEEDSPACRTHSELKMGSQSPASSIYLSSVFLSNRARVNPERPSLAYAMTIAARTPDYQIERRFWADQHYEGGNLFRDTAILEMTPPTADGGEWLVKLGWMSKSEGVATKKLKYTDLQDAGAVQVEFPFDSMKKPGIAGKIRLAVRPWS